MRNTFGRGPVRARFLAAAVALLPGFRAAALLALPLLIVALPVAAVAAEAAVPGTIAAEDPVLEAVMPSTVPGSVPALPVAGAEAAVPGAVTDSAAALPTATAEDEALDAAVPNAVPGSVPATPVAAVADAAPSATVAAEAEGQARAQEVDRRRQAIAELRSAAGNYDYALLEAHLGLAELLAENQEHAAAAAAYLDALQLSRVNSGLYSAEQLPILAALAESQGALAQWDEVDDYHELHQHIAQRIYAPGSADWLAAAERYGYWKLRALREGLTGGDGAELARATSAFFDEAFASAATAAPSYRLAFVRGKVQADLLLARSVAMIPYSSFRGTVNRYLTESHCRTVATAAGQSRQQCRQTRRENPLYRQSQRDAKQRLVNRHLRAVAVSMERLQDLLDSGELPAEQGGQDGEVARELAQLAAESKSIANAARRRSFREGFPRGDF